MKTLIIILFVCFWSVPTFAQIHGGIKGGPILADLVSPNEDLAEEYYEIKLSYWMGAYARLQLHQDIALQSELLYSSKGSQYRSSRANLHYLMLPLLVRYQVTDKLRVEAGPEAAYLISSRSTSNGSQEIPSLNSLDFGMNLGVVYALFSKFSLEARYGWGMGNILKDEVSEGLPPGFEPLILRNRTMQFALEFQLF